MIMKKVPIFVDASGRGIVKLKIQYSSDMSMGIISQSAFVQGKILGGWFLCDVGKNSFINTASWSLKPGMGLQVDIILGWVVRHIFKVFIPHVGKVTNCSILVFWITSKNLSWNNWDI